MDKCLDGYEYEVGNIRGWLEDGEWHDEGEFDREFSRIEHTYAGGARGFKSHSILSSGDPWYDHLMVMQVLQRDGYVEARGGDKGVEYRGVDGVWDEEMEALNG